ncbi:GTPase-activating protein GYP5, putative [Pediculus humanus corporis]|uniref:GTPase-activating protein GYP5, putative n=1 Tax=Pediculus humanus subsp. corporis TaxID=121224 RepID=E0W1N8_PEDHC|nr:GTPase-activating protein GYP5, putative [Pediculus humanus corporis]EEB19620.1 GTPase-activating protein GYP5, putative [Pediculus humanus corporis]
MDIMVAHSNAVCENASSPLNNNNNNNNNNSYLNSKEISTGELELLAKLEEANRVIEADAKSLSNLTSLTHSRKNSDISHTSLSSDKSEDSEENIWNIWGQVVNDWPNYYKKQNAYLRELVRKGIPHHFRGIAWQLLCGANDSSVKNQYAEYIKATSACEKLIRRDIARTYPEHEFFKEKDGPGQESLFNVMKAYSLHDREVGYCQGSGFIVGLLLMQMPEEEAFAVLVKLMQDYRMRDMFKPSMAELGLCMFQLENLIQELIPDIHVHFQSQSFHTSMYASSWFLTLFTTALSLPMACRIMDVFLLEGMEVIFKVALSLLTLGKEELLSLDMEGMLKQLPAKAEADVENVMNTAFSFKLNSKKMKKLEKEYQMIKLREQEEMIELKRLRSENRLLKKRIELLEAESSELADRLVKGQVSRAEEEETTFTVKREFELLKHTHLEVAHQLEMAHDEIRNLYLTLEQSVIILKIHSSQQSSMSEISMKKEQLSEKDDLIACLQDELVKVRLREAENNALIRDLRSRIQELEEDKKTLRESVVDNSVAHLQEELIAVKLREAEANLALKDLRHRVNELNSQWQRHLTEHRMEANSAPDSTPKKILFWDNRANETQRLEEELMTSRIREMEALTELRELRLKVMELETQVQVSTNQLRRQDEENKKLKEELEGSTSQEKEARIKLKEQQNKYIDLESKFEMLIKEAEHTQKVAELKQKISRLELKNHEMVAEGELRSNVDDSERVKELQDEVAYLKAELPTPASPDTESWNWIE